MRIVNEKYSLGWYKYTVFIPNDFDRKVYIFSNNELIALKLVSIRIANESYVSWCGISVDRYKISYNWQGADGILRTYSYDDCPEAWSCKDEYMNSDGFSLVGGNNDTKGISVMTLCMDKLSKRGVSFDVKTEDGGVDVLGVWCAGTKDAYFRSIEFSDIIDIMKGGDGNIEVKAFYNAPSDSFASYEEALKHRSINVVDFE